MQKLQNPRRIIDRKALSLEIGVLTTASAPGSQGFAQALLGALKQALESGRGELKRRFDDGLSGTEMMRAQAYLIDQLIRTLHDVTTTSVYPATNPTSGERLALIAVGGYGRADMAPASDVDILFLLPYKQTPWGEQVVEYMLYRLWDMGLKVGHSTRSVDDCIRLSGRDLTIRTALLEARYIWGDQALYQELKERFEQDVVSGSGPEFVEAKLAERDRRHQRMGNTRYVLEPNIKDGKGGLRDLHTLFWIGKYLYQVADVAALIDEDVLTLAEYQTFAKAEEFLRTVRCHLHYLAGRPEERLTFDVQPELASRLGYTDHAGSSGVERFMKHYFLVAKDVGDLTRIFCAALEDQHRRRSRFRFPRFGLRRREIDGFLADGGRLSFAEDGFAGNPVDLIRLFQVAQKHRLDIHPQALKQITRNLKLVNHSLRHDGQANALFMEILTSKHDPDISLMRLNEAGVFGRFIPDFGRIIAQMQHDMYHVYTVDEHTIRAIGVLARIESGEYAEDHPLACEIIDKVQMRRALYLAVLLHDIAKGRGGDHSILGAEIAERLGPRLGLEPEEVETVSWLVRWHLAMSSTAFKRDLNDPKAIQDFVELVQSPERLRLLLILTVADIRAVGPNVWNGWKGQLLRELYARAEEWMLGGHANLKQEDRAGHVKQALAGRLADWSETERQRHFDRGANSFWLSADLESHERWARLMRGADAEEIPLIIDTRVNQFQAMTEVTVFTADHAGLFQRLAGAIAASGASIVDARIFTTNDGMALDVFTIQDLNGKAFDRADRLSRLSSTIERTLFGEFKLARELPKQQDNLPRRADVFTVEPRVLIDNRASSTHTVVEVNGRDRPALLYDLTRAFFDLSLTIGHARIATYGERAVDVFYVKDLFGLKIENENKLKVIRSRLLEPLAPADAAPNAGPEAAGAAAAAEGAVAGG